MKKRGPLDNFIMVRPEEVETITKGGIHLIEHQQDKPRYGKVLEVGPECKDVAEGDCVLYGKYAGNEIKFKGEDILLLRESDLFYIDDNFENFK